MQKAILKKMHSVFNDPIEYFIDINGIEYKLRGKVVVLAASACSSARILLNSKSKQHPNGLGNSSDLVGKYLHDSRRVL